MPNLQGLKSGSYLERKRILHSVFINAKWPGKPLRDFSCSDPHFLLRGHPWDSSGKQGSHFLISCYTQQTRLKCLISCCSLPCLQRSEGKNNPSPTNRYNHSHFCTRLVWVRAQRRRWGWGRGGMDANTSICSYPSCWSHGSSLQNLTGPRNNAASSRFCVSKN